VAVEAMAAETEVDSEVAVEAAEVEVAVEVAADLVGAVEVDSLASD